MFEVLEERMLILLRKNGERVVIRIPRKKRPKPRLVKR
jgi:hypothetical protein